MTPFKEFPSTAAAGIRYLLSDIDDTLTTRGRLPAVAYTAMERLAAAGIRIIPITGRPAGWCDHIARMWPVEGLVGENGAFYFRYDPRDNKMVRRYWKTESERRKDRRKLDGLRDEILRRIPGCGIAADQPYREADLAIDFCEDVSPLPMASVRKIVEIFENAGARAKISSIHVNGWFGDYDKLAMTRRLFREAFDSRLDTVREKTVFIGDSPNDAPMFRFFPHSVGVANILRFRDLLAHEPAWVTDAAGGEGFAEMTDSLLAKRTVSG
jgi:HAD superfamily hydrolase (TIGR01484 family)